MTVENVKTFFFFTLGAKIKGFISGLSSAPECYDSPSPTTSETGLACRRRFFAWKSFLRDSSQLWWICAHLEGLRCNMGLLYMSPHKSQLFFSLGISLTFWETSFCSKPLFLLLLINLMKKETCLVWAPPPNTTLLWEWSSNGRWREVSHRRGRHPQSTHT